MIFFHILIAIFAFGFIIFFHELFHYLAARAVGIKPKEFAIGFGPSLIVYQKKKFYFLPKKKNLPYNLENISYHIKALPVGGYVMFERPVKNEKGELEVKGDYLKIHPLKRIIIALAGPIGNFILAFFLLLTLFSPFMSFNPEGKVIYVEENSIASSIGLKPQDRIIKMNGKDIHTLESSYDYITSQDRLCVAWISDNEIKEKCVDNKGEKIGIAFSLNIWQGIVSTGHTFIDTLGNYINSFIDFLLHIDVKELNGPVGTVDVIQQSVPIWDNFLSILIMVNIALGAANLLLPLSLTDGGKIAIDLICLIRRKQSINTLYLDLISIALMVCLFITTFYLDISRIAERFL